MPIGAIVLAALADGTSVATAMVVGGIICAVAAPLYIPAWRAEKARATVLRELQPPASEVSDSGCEGHGPLRVERHATAQAFLDAGTEFLAEREAEHNLIFGISATLAADPGYASEPYLATVSKAGRVVAAAIMTPPWNLVLSCVDDPDALNALATDLDDRGISMPGTTSPVETARRFAEGGARRMG